MIQQIIYYNFQSIAYQVNSNHRESPPSHALWFDNAQLMAIPLANGSGGTEESDVILIDDEEEENAITSDNQFAKKHSNSGLSIQDEQKFHICKICQSKLSSSYNLKRHMMIHTGKKKFPTKVKNSFSDPKNECVQYAVCSLCIVFVILNLCPFQGKNHSSVCCAIVGSENKVIYVNIKKFTNPI